MVNLTSIRRLIDCGSYSELINETDYKNLENLITHRQDVFGNKKLHDGVMFVQEYVNKKPLERSKYAFMMSQPTGIGQWQSINGKIYENKILNYILEVKSITLSNNEVEEELIFFEYFPLFAESISYIKTFISELLGVADIPDISTFLSNIDGLSEDYTVEYSLRYILHNHKSNSVKLYIFKRTDDTNNLTNLISKVATNKTSKLFQNANGVANCFSGLFYNENVNSSFFIEVTPDGICEQIGYAAVPGQSRELVNAFSTVPQDCENHIISESCRWGWIPEEHSWKISEWKNDNRFTNVFISFDVSVTSNSVLSKVIYGVRN